MAWARCKLTAAGSRLALALPPDGVKRLFAANNLLKWVDKPASAERDGPDEVKHACDTFEIDRLDLVRVAYKKGGYDKLDLPEQNDKLEPIVSLFRTAFPVDSQYHTARSAVTLRSQSPSGWWPTVRCRMVFLSGRTSTRRPRTQG